MWAWAQTRWRDVRTRRFLIDFVALLMLIMIAIPLEFWARPFHRMFYLSNPAISFPHAENESVTGTQLIFVAGVIPACFLIAWLLIFRPGWFKSCGTLLAFGITITLTSIITNTVKNQVGRPRPDLLARCKPAPDTPGNVLVDYLVCTGTNEHLLHDGWRSFPSGHSSSSFAALGFLSLFLAGQLRVFRPDTNMSFLLISAIPAFLALIIALSRLKDYRHDAYDVLAGSLIGIVVAISVYRRYFHSLYHRSCADLIVDSSAATKFRSQSDLNEMMSPVPRESGDRARLLQAGSQV